MNKWFDTMKTKVQTLEVLTVPGIINFQMGERLDVFLFNSSCIILVRALHGGLPCKQTKQTKSEN